MNRQVSLALALLMPSCAAPPGPGGAGGGGTTGTGGGGSGGYWESCCQNNPDGGRIGILSTCYCPGNYACNYGLGLMQCEPGTCVDRFRTPPDAGYCAP